MKSKVNFLIYGQGRSGSTLLIDLMNNNDFVICEGEIFSEKYWEGGFRRNCFKLIERIPHAYLKYKTTKAWNYSYGFKLLDYQKPQVDNFLEHLSDKGWIVIQVRRKSIFKMAVSNVIAQSSNKWVAKKGDKIETKTRYIDKYEFCGAISWIMKCEESIQANLANVAHHTVTYEDDLENEKNWAKTMDRLFNILKVDSMPVSSKYRKTDSRPLSGRITNYDELVSIAMSLGLKVD